jgi:hypothetical protein
MAAAKWFETRGFAALLTMRPGVSVRWGERRLGSHFSGHRLYGMSAQRSAVEADSARPLRRAEQARHPCKSTTRAGLSGEASSKEQGFGGSEQASGLIIQGINRRFTDKPSPWRRQLTAGDALMSVLSMVLCFI